MSHAIMALSSVGIFSMWLIQSGHVTSSKIGDITYVDLENTIRRSLTEYNENVCSYQRGLPGSPSDKKVTLR